MTLLETIQSVVPQEIRVQQKSELICEYLNEYSPRTVASGLEVGKGDVIQALGLTGANNFLDYIDNTTDFRHVKGLLAAGTLVISDPLVVYTINAMSGTVLTTEEANILLALAVRTTPYSYLEIHQACWANLGDWLA
jgi:hypothetical protein